MPTPAAPNTASVEHLPVDAGPAVQPVGLLRSAKPFETPVRNSPGHMPFSDGATTLPAPPSRMGRHRASARVDIGSRLAQESRRAGSYSHHTRHAPHQACTTPGFAPHQACANPRGAHRRGPRHRPPPYPTRALGVVNTCPSPPTRPKPAQTPKSSSRPTEIRGPRLRPICRAGSLCRVASTLVRAPAGPSVHPTMRGRFMGGVQRERKAGPSPGRTPKARQRPLRDAQPPLGTSSRQLLR